MLQQRPPLFPFPSWSFHRQTCCSQAIGASPCRTIATKYGWSRMYSFLVLFAVHVHPRATPTLFTQPTLSWRTCLIRLRRDDCSKVVPTMLLKMLPHWSMAALITSESCNSWTKCQCCWRHPMQYIPLLPFQSCSFPFLPLPRPHTLGHGHWLSQLAEQSRGRAVISCCRI